MAGYIESALPNKEDADTAVDVGAAAAAAFRRNHQHRLVFFPADG